MRAFTEFSPDEKLIYVGAEIHGPNGPIVAILALDTGATTTIVSKEIIQAAGYDLAVGRKVRMVTGSKVEYPYELLIDQIDAIGQSIKSLTVLCHNLPEESGLDGLLGLNFMRYFDTEIKYSNNTLTLTPV